MNYNNIVICENCYEENEDTRTTCKNCGAKLYNNSNEGKETSKRKNNIVKEEYTETSNTYFSTNKVAMAIKVISIVGAIVGIILGCTMLGSSYTETLGITLIVASIVSAVFVYALGEIIQLLEDIKNK